MRKFVPFVAVALFAAAPVQAQLSCDIANTASCPVGTTASMTMPSLLRLTLGSTTSSLAAPAAVGEFDPATGLVKKESDGPSVTVRANRGWSVTLQADAGTFTPALGATNGYAKPVSDLEVFNGTSWATVSNSTAVSITSGTATASNVLSTIKYRTLYNVALDKPDTYSLGITYTLTAN